jgi:hypothetical protein
MRVRSVEQVGEFRRDIDFVERLARQWRDCDAVTALACRALGGYPNNLAMSIGEQEHSRGFWHQASFLRYAARSGVSAALDIE